MRVPSRKHDPDAPKKLPRRVEYESEDNFWMARIRFISEDTSVAESDKFILRLAATFEHHKTTFNKLYRTLKEKQEDATASGGVTPSIVFGWPEDRKSQ
jgi:hypothetical protein